MKLTQMLLLLLELLLLLLHLFLPLFLQWFKQLQQQKQQQLQQQLQQQQHLCLNEKLILIQFNFISIDFVLLEFWKISFARGCSVCPKQDIVWHPSRISCLCLASPVSESIPTFGVYLACPKTSQNFQKHSKTSKKRLKYPQILKTEKGQKPSLFFSRGAARRWFFQEKGGRGGGRRRGRCRSRGRRRVVVVAAAAEPSLKMRR